MYAVRGEGLSGKMDDLVTYIIVTCDDDTYVDAAKRLTHRKGPQATIKFLLKVRRFNVIPSTCFPS